MTMREYIINSPRVHCPFCGKDNIKTGHVINVHAARSKNEYFQYCVDCEARGPLATDEVASMVMWDHWEEDL